ncbi:hypothetical protein E4U09_001838 [Claviceps aff. purpurea]|uniref:Uncharacterized protein n=1 Tax=Claviceps aff. purpurea TaxID=1967640 RepID=A0A9P7QGV4_9HYPO|nr:hypothetical protein E4U09_001838 [Claviceps aff. purpurea]
MPPLGEIDLNVVQRTPTTVTTHSPRLPQAEAQRGPKKLRLVDRLYTAPKPITRIERSYSPRTRDSVLMFLIHHRIYDPGHRKSIGGYRSPSQDEASKMFQIPMSTINTWWRKRDEEKFKKAVDRIISWPLLEKELYARFLEARRSLLETPRGRSRLDHKLPATQDASTPTSSDGAGIARWLGITVRINGEQQ